MTRGTVARSLALVTVVSLNWILVDHAGAQGVAVGSGVVVNLGNSTVYLNCNDLTIQNGGRVNAQSAVYQTSRHLTIDPGGFLNGENATIRLCGTWTNNGTFAPGASTVIFYTDCGVSNDVQGSGDSDGDGIPDGEDPDFLTPGGMPIPTASSWGVLLMACLILGVGVVALRWRGAA